MEDIILPFKRGSMEDIEDMTGETEAAASQGDSQETQKIYEREAQLVIDYRRYLEKPLRSLDNEKEVSKSIVLYMFSRERQIVSTIWSTVNFA